LLPTERELRDFLADGSPDKRAGLVDSLLARRGDYAEHWISFWNDLLRNDEQTRSREPFTGWLYQALATNKPYDLFVQELLNPPKKDGPKGYIKGVDKWETVDASQSPPV